MKTAWSTNSFTLLKRIWFGFWMGSGLNLTAKKWNCHCVEIFCKLDKFQLVILSEIKLTNSAHSLDSQHSLSEEHTSNVFKHFKVLKQKEKARSFSFLPQSFQFQLFFWRDYWLTIWDSQSALWWHNLKYHLILEQSQGPCHPIRKGLRVWN